MKVLALVPSVLDTSPGQRYRLEQWDPLLRARRVDIEYYPFMCEDLGSLLYVRGRMAEKLKLVARAFARRAALMRSLQEYEVVYVYREAALFGPPIFEYIIHRAGIPMVFDFDDAIFVPYVSPTHGYLSYLKFPHKTRTVCHIASQVIAGNRYLAEYALQVNPRTTVVPSTIDTDKYRVVSNESRSDLPVIVWTGSHSTIQHLNTLRGPLRSLAARERFRLRVIGAPGYSIDGVEVDAIPWRSATEVSDLQSAHIGVMPLPDERWAQGKCGMKALQYMGLGIPAVCSPTGANSEIIQDGQNGFLASTDAEWVEKLTRLLHSAALRLQLGLAGRKTVELRYSAQVQAPRVYEVFKAALDDKRSESAGFA